MANKTMNPDLANAVEQLGTITGLKGDQVQSMLATNAQAMLEKAHAKARASLHLGKPPRRYQGNRRLKKTPAPA